MMPTSQFSAYIYRHKNPLAFVVHDARLNVFVVLPKPPLKPRYSEDTFFPPPLGFGVLYFEKTHIFLYEAYSSDPT